jgi:hypothetical protein
VRLLSVRARSLAQLGRGADAALAAQEAVSLGADDPGAAFAAALVAAINGDIATCLAWTGQALERGTPRAFFSRSEFAAMAANAEFRALLATR